MRFLFGLLLVLVLLPAGGFVAPCCADEPSEACCPLDGNCAADEGPCPAAGRDVGVACVSFVPSPPAAAPALDVVFLAAPADPAPLARALRPGRRLPLRN